MFAKGHRKKANENLMSAIEQVRGGSYLEVGIGPKVRFKRVKKMHEMGISYTGLDFKPVCDMHLNEIMKKKLPSEHLRFVANDVGTYLYNLIRLQREGKKFDLIYLDGHHTLYVDFASALACVPLLKPGGLFALDDISWKLSDKEASLKNSAFYSQIYDFSLYTPEEKREAHIGLIINEYLVPHFGFKRVEELCLPTWALLQSAK